MYNRTVPGNTNSYTVTGLSGDVNYNVSVAAVNMCGVNTSDPVTVYGECTPCALFLLIQVLEIWIWNNSVTILAVGVHYHTCLIAMYCTYFYDPYI